MNPSIMLELVRIESGLTNCVHAVKITRSDFDSLRKLGYSVIAYQWLFDPITLSPSKRISFYICRDREEALNYLRKIEKLEKKITKENIKKIIKIEGKLLGYPKCCIKKFSKLKVAGRSPEKDIIIECIEKEVFYSVLKGYPDPELPEIAYSLFTTNFYPCKIDCERAVEIGKYLTKYDRRYKYKIVLSVLNLLPPVFEIYRRFEPKTEFGKLVHSFVRSLHEIKSKADCIVEKIMSDPSKFEVDYLNSVLSDMHD